MTDKQTGGPAFPLETSTAFQNPGMTLRDYFAAKAMQVYMDGVKWNADSYAGAAKASYNVADAMLKARDGNP